MAQPDCSFRLYIESANTIRMENFFSNIVNDREGLYQIFRLINCIHCPNQKRYPRKRIVFTLSKVEEGKIQSWQTIRTVHTINSKSTSKSQKLSRLTLSKRRRITSRSSSTPKSQPPTPKFNLAVTFP